MKQIFVINNFDKLNEIAYCSKRIKEHLDANYTPDKNIVVMVTHAEKNMNAHKTLKNVFGISKALFYNEHQASYAYHDIHHIESEIIVLMLDENGTSEVVKALMHNPAFDVKVRSIQLFSLCSACICEYVGEL